MIRPLLLFKRLICWLGYGDRLLEFCDHCGGEVEVSWHADDALWDQIADITVGGCWCVRCFDAECYRQKLHVKWKPEVLDE